MKKLIALVLTVLMLVSAVPMTVSAATVDAKINGPIALTDGVDYTAAGIDYVLAEENGENYVHGVVAPGTYQNNKLTAIFAPVSYSLTEYKYIKICYRTDSPSTKMDVSARSSVGESWMNAHPACIGDGQWHEVVINTDDIIGGKGRIPAGEVGAQFILQPFDSLTITLNREYFFDIKYIACFKTEAEANAYKYTKADDKASVDLELVDIFWEEATDEVINGYMKTMDEMIENIENSPTTVEVTGTKYYVSESGDDSNDGLTPETAWRTVTKVNTHTFNSGDGVFFNRGDEWRITSPLSAKSGVTYSAYGSGAKPKLIASADGSGSAKWIPTAYENVYAFVENIPGTRDVGTLVFDGGRAWGIQIQQTKEGNRLPIGTVFNGISRFTSDNGPFAGPEDLKNDLEFYHDWTGETLYLYSKEGNPSVRFSSIEIVDKGHGISLSNDTATNNAHDIVIDNIAIFGAGSHGIGGGNVKNVTIQYCTLKWIGGSIQGKYIFNSNYGVRYGNAVESYGNSDNFVIHDCYASQVYDCCWTVQTQAAGQFYNVKMYNNVSEYCNSGLEVWQSGGTISDMDLYNNYTRFNGYGWSHQRPNKDGNFFYGASGTGTYINNHVRNNVNVFASANALLCRSTGPEQYNFHDNVYIMESDKYMGGLAANPGLGTGGWGSMNTKYTEAALKRAVSTGFEKGAKFYYTEPSAYTEDMYDTYNPEVGVDVFEDIADNFWGRNAVDYVALKGYFNGVSETSFAPNGTMTRAMLVTVLSRIAGESANAADATFTDINKNAWYASGVAWAEKAGIVNAGGKFRPDENATREELADMLYRYALYVYRSPDLTKAPEFKDMASVNAAYADGIKFCTSNGIIGGYTDGTIKPKNSATRVEVATMIQRFNNYLSVSSVDKEKALAGANMTIVKSDELKKLLDNSGVRATTEADGTVKFVPFLQSGAPRIRILDMLSKEIDLIDHPYLVVKFEGEINSRTVVATVDSVNISNSATTYMNIASYASFESGSMIIDLSSLYETINRDSYTDNLAINIFPWGQEAVVLSNTEYFIIDEIAFFDSAVVAEAYAS